MKKHNLGSALVTGILGAVAGSAATVGAYLIYMKQKGIREVKEFEKSVDKKPEGNTDKKGGRSYNDLSDDICYKGRCCAYCDLNKTGYPFDDYCEECETNTCVHCRANSDYHDEEDFDDYDDYEDDEEDGVESNGYCTRNFATREEMIANCDHDCKHCGYYEERNTEEDFDDEDWVDDDEDWEGDDECDDCDDCDCEDCDDCDWIDDDEEDEEDDFDFEELLDDIEEVLDEENGDTTPDSDNNTGDKSDTVISIDDEDNATGISNSEKDKEASDEASKN